MLRYDWSTFDMEATKTWFLEKWPEQADRWHLWERALIHRHAWKCGRIDMSASPKAMIEEFIDLTSDGNDCAWIEPDGTIHWVDYASHCRYADIILGAPEWEIEKDHVKVSHYTSSIRYATNHLLRPPKKQVDAIYTVIERNPKVFPEFR